jgi:hypothetical protein
MKFINTSGFLSFCLEMKIFDYCNQSYFGWSSCIFRLLISAFISLSPASSVTGQNSPDNNPKPAPPAEPAQAPPRRPPAELQKALEEFRVQMGQPGAAKGVARQSKTTGKQNTLTGRVYEYFRNDFLDAVPHEVKQRGGTKSLLRRNQYGFSVSGPVVFPKVYDGRGRTFFSASFEGTRERIAQSSLFTIPTGPQRLGDFSDLVDSAGQPVLIYDPATTRLNPNFDPAKPVSIDNLQYLRDPFPKNVIPANRIDPVSRRLVELYPSPNIAVDPFLSNNYWINSPFENRADGVIAKLDHRLTEKQQLSVNLNRSRGIRKSLELYPGPANAGSPSYRYENGGLTLQDSYTASPRLVWTFRGSVSYSTTDSLENDASLNYPDQIGLSGLFSPFFPRFVFSGNYLSIGPSTAVFRQQKLFIQRIVFGFDQQ